MTVLHMFSLGWSALRLGFSLRSLSSAAKAESACCSPHTEQAGFRNGGGEGVRGRMGVDWACFWDTASSPLAAEPRVEQE